MTLKRSFAFKTLWGICALFLFSYAAPGFIPKAHALYWEDDEEGNDPQEVKQRPDHFSLFDWIGDAQKDSQKQHYRDMDNHDHGPGVNTGAKILLVGTSGLVGAGAGLFLSYEFTTDENQLEPNMFIGGALGLCAGIAIGALIMPPDYEVNPQARMDLLKEREAWSEDPTQVRIRKAFTPTQTVMTVRF